MSWSPSKRPPPWNKVSLAQPICSSTPSLRSKGANASPTPPRCTRLKKTPSTHRGDDAPRPPAGPGLASASAGAEPDLAKGHAQLWPPVSRPGQSLRHVGARHRTALVSLGGAHGYLEPASQRVLAPRPRAESGPTRASAEG